MELSATKSIAKIRSLGFFTKGMVYLMVGVLTFMAAFNWGGSISSSNNVVRFLLDLPMGEILVGTTSLGLFAYSLWRFYQVILVQRDDNENKAKGGFKMLRYFYSGLFYITIAYTFAKPLINTWRGKARDTGGDSNNEERAALWELLNHDWGKILLWALALLIAGQALQQFYISYKAGFMKKIDNYPQVKYEYDLIRKVGRFGYVARGVVFGILSFFVVRVILSHNANAYKGTQGALRYLLSFDYGTMLLATVALGLAGYGIFNIMVARHANLTRIG
ncbi:MAG TPA: DUF1206 domain-containing protein [Gillisia sp.]|nr:DUF1206 domain-containing protein [Gillisia sp.]